MNASFWEKFNNTYDGRESHFTREVLFATATAFELNPLSKRIALNLAKAMDAEGWKEEAAQFLANRDMEWRFTSDSSQ